MSTDSQTQARLIENTRIGSHHKTSEGRLSSGDMRWLLAIAAVFLVNHIAASVICSRTFETGTTVSHYDESSSSLRD